MVSQTVTITNPTGLHLRPAGNLCKEAMKFKCHVTFGYRGNTANAKSVLSVLGACIKNGDEITLQCDGEDEEEALKTLVAFVESGLGENQAQDLAQKNVDELIRICMNRNENFVHTKVIEKYLEKRGEQNGESLGQCSD